MNAPIRYMLVLVSTATVLTVSLCLAFFYIYHSTSTQREAMHNRELNEAPFNGSLSNAPAQVAGIPQNITGKQIFTANCKQCHDIESVVIGPALKDVHKRRDAAWIYSFVANPEKMIKAKDKVALQLYDQYKQIMPSHEFLTTAEIDSIIDYIKFESLITK